MPPTDSGPLGSATTGQPIDPLRRFGDVCPVCGAVLGPADPPEIDRDSGLLQSSPSFLLELGYPERQGGRPWRITPLPVGIVPGKVSSNPPFLESEYSYLLCGDGHIFPYTTPRATARGIRGETLQAIDAVNMVATIGAPASGKTYLMVRVLQQDLDNSRTLLTGETERIRVHHLTPLEAMPMLLRSKMYLETLSTGRVIMATGIEDEGNPAGILERVSADLIDAIRDTVTKSVVYGEHRSDRWGTGFRQPLVLRTSTRGGSYWTGVADLPGEMFGADHNSARETAVMGAFDAMVWVIDPAISSRVDQWLGNGRKPSEDPQYQRVLDGSLRPGTVASAHGNVNQLRSARRQIQHDIERYLTHLESGLVGMDGTPLPMLVTITKCDLIRTALQNGKKLSDLGEGDTVAVGAAHYLELVSRRWGQGTLSVDTAAQPLLHYLYGGAEYSSTLVHRQRCAQVAHGMLQHHCDPDRFWNLVHVGEADTITIRPGNYGALQELPIMVPSVLEHLDAARCPGSAEQILLRDLVMSTVGCGIAYGLGYEKALYSLLNEESQNTRCFLCSPLGTVPVGAGEMTMQPLGERSGAHFEEIHGRSAALTQLLLAVLGKVRR